MMNCDHGRPWEGPVYAHCKHWYHGDICCWCDEFDEPLRDLLDLEEHDDAWMEGLACSVCRSGADGCVEPLSGTGAYVSLGFSA